jgi:hypothetical protein
LALIVVRDLREYQPSASAEERDQLETDVLAGFVLARAPPGCCPAATNNDQQRRSCRRSARVRLTAPQVANLQHHFFWK